MQTLHGQGTGRYSAGEIKSFRREIWEGINALLLHARKMAKDAANNEPFWLLGGDHPTEADTTVFAFITSVLVSTAYVQERRIARLVVLLIEITDAPSLSAW